MRTLVSFFLLLIIVSCKSSSDLKSGDIIFRCITSGSLSKAINEVTQTSKATNYSHIGIVHIEANKVKVYHSDLGRGVVKETLEQFSNATDSVTYNLDVYRIKNISSNQVKDAILKADSLIGNPYNITYILEDEGYYCSEFIYELFKADSIFQLEPMTFKNPKTQKFHQGWIDHYKDLKISIPEGQLGCNPNGMASSKSLYLINQLK